MTRVLIVDDQAQNRYLLEALLKGYGYEVISAGNGAEALRLAGEYPPDLIVTDILMPVMDGFALCRQWKTEESLKEIPFVFYTATYTEPKDERFALSLGADRYIIKPAEPQLLARAVEEVLEEYRRKRLLTPHKPLGEEAEFFRQHNEALFRKLEHKMEELEKEVHERKQAELALRESEGFLKSIVDNIPDMIFVKEAKELRFVRFNKAGEELLGYSRAELYGRNDFDFFPEEEALFFRERDGEVLSERKLVDIPEETIQTRYKGTRTLHTKKIPILDEQGNPRFLLGISEDITERRKAEDALAQSEARYRLLFERSLAGVFRTDPEGRLYEANPALAKMLGFENPVELLRHSVAEVYADPEERDRIMAILKRDGSFSNMSVAFKDRHGQRRDILLSAAVIRDDPEGMGFIEGTVIDVTELQSVREDLERARRLETIGMITGGVAHEARNPLFALATMTAALERKLADQEEVRGYTEHIKEQVNRLNTLMEDLLAYGRPLEPSTFIRLPLPDILESALKDLEAGDPGVRDRIRLEAPDAGLALTGMPDKLCLVFVNLLRNALSFAPAGQPVSVTCWPDGRHACVSIADCGPGIQAALLPRLFEPFVSQRKGGTGLGLAIVRKIVETHGGTVTARNNDPPPGATFTVRLPIAEEGE